MRPERTLRVVAVAALVILVVTLIVTTIVVIGGWWAALALLGVVAVSVVTLRVLGRRVPRGTVLEVDLDGGLVETGGSDPLTRVMRMGSVTVRDLVDALTRAGDDRRVSGLVARLGNGGVDLAHAQELRDAIHRFRDSGKRAVAFAEAFGENHVATVDYYLAAAFDEIHLQPRGLVSIEGVVARATFIRGVFDKLGLLPDFDHRKEYKAAKYRLTETSFNDDHREAVEAVAADRFAQVIAGIAADRRMGPEEVERLVDGAPLTAAEALEAGLIDRIGHREQAYEAAGKRFMYHDRYLKRAGRPHRRGTRVALIFGTGSITRGSSQFDPLSRGSSLGADEVARAFREAIDDEKVKAIVFRVDSPGGSAVASEVVGHEVARARAAGKPVVVSMGSVAGSGGYWVSAGADSIVAQPGTVTGSIGVVWGKLATREAWTRVGVTFDQIQFGRNATFTASQDSYSDTERERLSTLLDSTYDDFVALVAAGRGLTAAEVEEVARGRIWTGQQARDRGLVDELGGLETAIEIAKELASIEREATIRVMTFPRERTLPIPEGKDSSEPIGAALRLIENSISAWQHATSGAQARMPGVGFD